MIAPSGEIEENLHARDIMFNVHRDRGFSRAQDMLCCARVPARCKTRAGIAFALRLAAISRGIGWRAAICLKFEGYLLAKRRGFGFKLLRHGTQSGIISTACFVFCAPAVRTAPRTGAASA